MTTRTKVYCTISILLSVLVVSLVWRHFDASGQYTGFMSAVLVVIVGLNLRLFTEKSKDNS